MNTNLKSFFTSDQLKQLDPQAVPYHIAVIPDGNRRWAIQHQISTLEGHRYGCDNLLDIVEAAEELGVKVFTFFAFSTENWTRSKEEVEVLWNLLENYLISQRDNMKERGIRLCTIGYLDSLSDSVKKAIADTKRYTEDCNQIDLVLAINYGGRDEICRSFHRILDDYAHHKIQKEELTEAAISRYLDTSQWPDPDLFIRTSGEQRISNFLLWQLSYTEFYLPTVLWPDFSPNHLLEAVQSYQKRDRRLGGT